MGAVADVLAEQTRVDDPQFIQEIMDLVNGTHWMKGELQDWCYVAVKPDEKEELEKAGEELVEDYDYYEVERYDQGKRKTYPKTKLCYKKSRNCLVGMVLRIAGLEQSEKFLHDHEQSRRIIAYIYDALPADFRESGPSERLGISDQYEYIESFNDDEGTERKDILNVLKRAKKMAEADAA